MNIIIVRHGETVENAKHILMGHLPGTLSAKGRRQARKLARELMDEKIAAIYSSDLRRAVDPKSAKAIAKYHKVPIYYTKELREQSYGIFQGRPLGEFIDAQGRRKCFVPRGGESLFALRKRTGRFLIKLGKDRLMKGKTILVSAHAGVAASVLSLATDMKMREVMRLLKPRNTGTFVAKLNGSKFKIVKDNMYKPRNR
jgi:probable phosphoglycerate mutase